MASIPNERGFSHAAPLIYTSNANGVQVYETPAASTGQQASQPTSESLVSAGIMVPVVQVVSEYVEAGIFATKNSGAPSAGHVEGINTTVYKASQSTSTGNEQNPGSGQSNPFLVSPWSVDSSV